MTTWTERLDRIALEAKQLTPGRAVASVITAPFVVLGWAFGLVWQAIALAWTAGVVGFREAKRIADPKPGE